MSQPNSKRLITTCYNYDLGYYRPHQTRRYSCDNTPMLQIVFTPMNHGWAMIKSTAVEKKTTGGQNIFEIKKSL